jgi:hypothetical protein
MIVVLQQEREALAVTVCLLDNARINASGGYGMSSPEKQ